MTTSWAAIGWPGQAPRWWLPRSPGAVTAAAMGVYRPLADTAIAGWSVARVGARLGAFRLAARGPAPPVALDEVLAPYIPINGTAGVMRSNHADRYLALIMNHHGQPVHVAKVALSKRGESALHREAQAIDHYGRYLTAPLSSPRVMAAAPGVLLTAVVNWRLRRRSWRLAPDLAASLGRFYSATSSSQGGLAHGDFAPWNLLYCGHGYVLIDWEQACAEAPPYLDIFHFLVQSHTLLGHPTASELCGGVLMGHGWIAGVIDAYRRAADLDGDVAPHFERYLRRSANVDPRDGPSRVRRDASRLLLAEMRRHSNADEVQSPQ